MAGVGGMVRQNCFLAELDFCAGWEQSHGTTHQPHPPADCTELRGNLAQQVTQALPSRLVNQTTEKGLRFDMCIRKVS